MCKQPSVRKGFFASFFPRTSSAIDTVLVGWTSLLVGKWTNVISMVRAKRVTSTAVGPRMAELWLHDLFSGITDVLPGTGTGSCTEPTSLVWLVQNWMT